jgi:hypothetical protein
MGYSFYFLMFVLIICIFIMIVEGAKPVHQNKMIKPRHTIGRPKKDNKSKSPFNKDDPYQLYTLKSGAEKLSEFVKYEAEVIQKVFKGAFDMVSVKHVSYFQIIGKWKIYQDVELQKDSVISYPVTIELMEDGTIKSRYNNVEYNSTFKFVERQWPKKCSIEFEILSHKNDDDPEPTPLLYKGYFKRSMMNSQVVFMKGRLFQTTGKAL